MYKKETNIITETKIKLITTEQSFEWTVKKLLESPGHEVMKLFSCSIQLRLKITLLLNVKTPTKNVGI